MQRPRASCPVGFAAFSVITVETLCAVVCTPECQAQAEETEAAEAVEDFHVEVTDYIVQLCLAT